MFKDVVVDPNPIPDMPAFRDVNGRRVPTATSFSDITTKAVTNIVEDGPTLTVSFETELTMEEFRSVVRRILQNESEELREKQAKAAIKQINTYLAIGTPTNAQVVSQVRLLSKAVKQLIMMAVEDAVDDNPNA